MVLELVPVSVPDAVEDPCISVWPELLPWAVLLVSERSCDELEPDVRDSDSEELVEELVPAVALVKYRPSSTPVNAPWGVSL